MFRHLFLVIYKIKLTPPAPTPHPRAPQSHRHTCQTETHIRRKIHTICCVQSIKSRKHTYIILTPLNPTFI